MGNIETASFDVMTVPLKGSNLIEASAGTGKTFSIAVMILRLILRQYSTATTLVKEDTTPLYINQLLVVTFTTSAVAELEDRVRKYIYIAEKYISSKAETKMQTASEFPFIVSIVELALLNGDKVQIERTLKDNLLLLDEVNIMTIHSFCQSTLNEFAIETRQLFGISLFTDTDNLLETEINKFWRKYITTLDTFILRGLDLEKTKKNLKEVVKYHLDGKYYAYYEPSKNYSEIDSSEMWSNISDRVYEEKESGLLTIETMLTDVTVKKAIENSSATKRTKDKYISVLSDTKAFIDVYAEDGGKYSSTKAKTSLPESLKLLLDAYITKYYNVEDYIQRLFFIDINNLAIQEITKGYFHFLSANNFMTYDDLIDKLHTAIKSSSSERLKEKLNDKYKAVFVDEFQDTDKKQYEIFYETFASNSILFLIGDPKQSIYGWRKADLLTYFKARSQVDKVYHMNVNYRSSESAVSAMNRFFKPVQDFDTFLYNDQVDGINYMPVETPTNSSKGNLEYNGESVKGMELLELSNQSQIVEAVSSITLDLLTTDNYRIKGKKITPSSIGVVVRTNKQAMQIKTALSRKNIPSVVVNEEKVLKSKEARDVVYLLYAIWEPSLANINRCLMTDIIGVGYQDILRLEDNTVLNIFQQLNSMWKENGVYPMLVKFTAVFDIERKWKSKIEGERILTNFFHIVELLNQVEKTKNFSQEELIAWLQRSVDGLEHSGDEYELRMESDENTVKIVTIHKSKGLEYDIVIAPFLDMNSSLSSKKTFVHIYDEENAKYLTKEVEFLSEEEKINYEIEQERENRRLIYVAITRSAYKFYVLHSQRESKSSLSPFFDSLSDDVIYSDETIANSIELPSFERVDNNSSFKPLIATHFELKETNWRRLSFTALSNHGEISLKEKSSQFENPYDAFVFNQLKFGAASGNLLHGILENIDFATDKRRTDVVRKILQSYLPNRVEEVMPNIELLLDNVLNLDIEIGGESFQLNQITKNKRLSELEFDFPFQHFDYDQVRFVLKDYCSVNTRRFDMDTLDGLMNGKIDLFFEHNGKYYLMDWKSNYLGYNLTDYNKDGVLAAMNENNYHLQYLLYIVAAKRMLASQLPYFNYEKQFGGVVYLFLRGVRKGFKSGIFTAKPPYRIIAALENLFVWKMEV